MRTETQLPSSAAPRDRAPTLRRGAAVLFLLAAGWQVQGATAAEPSPTADPPAARELVVCADPANLPYSDQRELGFENRIATLLAQELNATLRYSWNMQRRSFLRRTLNAGRCDVVIGLPSGLQGVAQTRPYYRSSYVFVTRQGEPIGGLDDPRLRQLSIGLQAVGAEGANTPPAMALARRGVVDHITGYPVWGEDADETPQARMLQAVVQGEIDVAILWGPIAGYFAESYRQRLLLTALEADPQQPGLAFSYSMSLSTRRADTALRDELQRALERREVEIQAILRSYHVPLLQDTASSQHAFLTAGQPARPTGD